MCLLHFNVDHIILLRHRHSLQLAHAADRVPLPLHWVVVLSQSTDAAGNRELHGVCGLATCFLFNWCRQATIIHVNWADFIGRKWGSDGAHCCKFSIWFEQFFDLEDALPFLKSSIELSITVKSIINWLVVERNVVVDAVWKVKVGGFLRLFYHCYLFLVVFLSTYYDDNYDYEICCCLSFL